MEAVKSAGHPANATQWATTAEEDGVVEAFAEVTTRKKAGEEKQNMPSADALPTAVSANVIPLPVVLAPSVWGQGQVISLNASIVPSEQQSLPANIGAESLKSGVPLALGQRQQIGVTNPNADSHESGAPSRPVPLASGQRQQIGVTNPNADSHESGAPSKPVPLALGQGQQIGVTNPNAEGLRTEPPSEPVPLARASTLSLQQQALPTNPSAEGFKSGASLGPVVQSAGDAATRDIVFERMAQPNSTPNQEGSSLQVAGGNGVFEESSIEPEKRPKDPNNAPQVAPADSRVRTAPSQTAKTTEPNNALRSHLAFLTPSGEKQTQSGQEDTATFVYPFQRWGSGHSVNVRMSSDQTLLQPSNVMVHDRLADRWNTGNPQQWQLTRDDKDGEARRQRHQSGDDEDA